MKFKSKKDIFLIIIIFGINTYLIATATNIVFTRKMEGNAIFALFLILATIGLTLWLFFGTHYKLSKENGLIYRGGPFYGAIGLERITKIVKNKTLWVGFKPATSRKGLIIKYDKHNEIYISPKTNESFIEQIIKLNKDIKVVS